MTASARAIGFHVRQGRLWCDDVELRQIAARYDTPCYVYSRAFIQRQLGLFAEAFAGIRVTPCYAAKANTNPVILELIANFRPESQSTIKWGMDAVSGKEIEAGLTAGFTPENMIFSGVGKRQAEIELAIQHGVTMNVESLFELRDIIECAKKMKKRARIGLRVNPDVDAKTHPKITTGTKKNKFGLSMEMVDQALNLSHDHSEAINLSGLSIHIGSQITDVTVWAEAARALVRLADDVNEARRATLEFIDFGGGFPIRYRGDGQPPAIKEFADAVRSALAEARCSATRSLAVFVEPGRWVVAEAGGLLSSVMGVKGGQNEGLNETFVIIDASMTELLRPALYDACHDITFEAHGISHPTAKLQNQLTTCIEVVGPVCESSDSLGSGIKIDELPHKNQLLVIHQAGAYGFTMASHYNQRPLPPEILVEKNRSRLIRPRQNP